MAYKVKSFERTTNAFNYVFEYGIPAGETILLKMPVVSANKRGINDIGWQCDSDDVQLFGTLSHKPEKTSLWSEIKEDYVVNKTISALKFVNSGSTKCNVFVRVILN